MHRGRDFEKDITLDYLQKLDHQYKEFLLDISKTTLVFQVDWIKFMDPSVLWDEHIVIEIQKSTDPRVVKIERETTEE